MQKFLAGFADEGWKIDEKNKLVLLSDDGKSKFIYVDYSNACKEVRIREIIISIDGDKYGLMEYPLEDGPVYVLVMPFCKNCESPGQEEAPLETYYGADGVLNRRGDLSDLPKKIDMDKTVELFLKQVTEKNFSVPVLVKVE